MDRTGALRAARDAASLHRIGPSQYREALAYQTDDNAKSFIELEGGGVEVLKRVMSQGTYSPYTWQVRHFNEAQTWEATLFYSSDGRFLGFREKLPEKETNANLEEAEARSVAENALHDEYGYNLAKYRLAETSSEEKIGGRKDRTFVYEDIDQPFGEGKIRLTAVVGGNRLTEVNQFLKVPESFARRYEAARSWNVFISFLSMVCFIFLFAAAAWGFVYLLRKKFLIWKAPVYLGFGLSLWLALSNLNSLPLQWMNYDTALSATAFIVRLIVISLLIFIFMGAVFSFSIMVAEGLTRRAFPEHIQFWKLSSAAASVPVLKRTVGALLAVPFMILYLFLFYDIAKGVFGWWTPAESLTDPNVVAQYLPWFSSFAGAIQAGIWEELFFRALPIAGAALIGEKFKRRNLMIGIAVALQAIIFAAGHAGYPGLPGYSRLVEVIIPAVFFGLIYIRFGILPGILIHFGYDLVLMAQPIFTSTVPSMRIDRIVIVFILLLPLLYVLSARMRRKEACALPLNGAWSPSSLSQTLSEVQTDMVEGNAGTASEIQSVKDGGQTGNAINIPSTDPINAPSSYIEDIEAPIQSALTTSSMPVVSRFISLVIPTACVVLGLAFWIFGTDFSAGTGDLTLDRHRVETLVDSALKARGISIPQSWKYNISANTELGIEDRYVWSTARNEYNRLKGAYLLPNRWIVQYADFAGEAAYRESYEISVSDSGDVLRIIHSVPESKPGKSLTKEEAETISLKVLEEQFRIKGNEAREVSAKDEKLPGRVNWTLDYSIPKDSLGGIDTRVKVVIAGDEIVDANRYVFVPEDWSREFQRKASNLSVAKVILVLFLFAVIVTGIVQALRALSRKRFSVFVSLAVGGVILLSGAAGFFNVWNSVVAKFTLNQPYGMQTVIFVMIGIVGTVIVSAAFGIIAGFIWSRNKHGISIKRDSILNGLGAGLLIAGTFALAGKLVPSELPSTADFANAGNLFPWATASLNIISSLPTSIIGFSLVLLWFRRLQEGAVVKKALGILVVVLFAVASKGADIAPSLSALLVVSAFIAALWAILAFTVFRRSLTALPIAVAVTLALELVKLAVQNPYSSAIPEAILAFAVTSAMAVLLSIFRETAI